MRLFISGISTFGLLAVGMMLTHAEAPRVTHVLTYETLQLKEENQASLNAQSARYEASGLFLSPVFEAEQDFQLLGLNWHEGIPAETAATMEIRFRTQNHWGDWQALHEDEDGDAPTEGFWTYMLTDDSDAFQYRTHLSTQNSGLTPKLSNVSFDLVSGGSPAPLSRLTFNSDAKVHSRKEWGANENVRLASNFGAVAGSHGEDAEADTQLDELLDHVVTENEKGQPYWWPLEYPKSVEKIIIHHTATEKNLNHPDEVMRAIYQYHAVTRGWGDIGYNYIIAPNGEIFEGRFGGPGVVGAHARNYNTGSVGIALMGNYETSELPGPMLKSLNYLVLKIAEENKIDPTGRSVFRGQDMANIVGHRDVGRTTCPGGNTYDFLPEVRRLAGAAYRQEDAKGDWAYKEEADRDMLLLNPTEEKSVTLKIKNTGKNTWNSSTFLTVNANEDADEKVKIAKDAQKSVAKMKETSVAPGRVGTFEFKLKAQARGGFAEWSMVPVFNGTKKSDTSMPLVVFITQPELSFEIKSKEIPTLIKAGEKATLSFTLKNTGNVAWQKTGDSAVELTKGSSSSLITASGTLATLKEDRVEPGKTGTFSFSVTAPATSGNQSLKFRLKMPKANLQTPETEIKIKTSSSNEKALILSNSDFTTFAPGQEQTLWVQVQNLSSQAWKSADMGLSVSSTDGLTVSNVKMGTATLSSGLATRVYFKVKAPQNPGDYVLKITPTVKGQKMMKTPYSLSISVVKAEARASWSLEDLDYERPIRIKLNATEKLSVPLVSADEDFALFAEGKWVHTFARGESLRLTPTSTGFLATSGSNRWELKEPVTVSPKSGEDGVLSILNMERRPAWNLNLNDNQFRGNLEFRLDGPETLTINELPLESYLRGIGEESNSSPAEKIKTILVLARTYAAFYLTEAEKFPGKPYDLTDSPEDSQKYLGYGFEQRSPNVIAAVKATENKIVTYKGKIVKTPYFSQSDGTKTKSAKDVWGWTNTPYLVSVDDSMCDADKFLGHGVGLSGCGATAMAEDGKSFSEIIQYYYTGVKIEDLK